VSNDNNDVVIAAGNSYFLHFTSSGEEQRFTQEPSHLHNRTIYINVISVDHGFVVEETIVKGELKYPFGRGWQHVKGNLWRRRRVL
jgi:hypothetical protein